MNKVTKLKESIKQIQHTIKQGESGAKADPKTLEKYFTKFGEQIKKFSHSQAEKDEFDDWGEFGDEVLKYLGVSKATDLTVIYSVDYKNQEEIGDLGPNWKSTKYVQDARAPGFSIGIIDFGQININGKWIKAVATQNASPIGVYVSIKDMGGKADGDTFND